MLEEYVDCLHFFLSIGLEIGIDFNPEVYRYQQLTVLDQFRMMFDLAGHCDNSGEWLWAFGAFAYICDCHQ